MNEHILYYCIHLQKNWIDTFKCIYTYIVIHIILIVKLLFALLLLKES